MSSVLFKVIHCGSRIVAKNSFTSVVVKSRTFRCSPRILAISKDYEEHLIDDDDQDAEKQYEELTDWAHLQPHAGHQVFVIQPFVKWGENKIKNTTPDLMLDEAAALVDSLPNWKCADRMKVSLATLNKKELFGRGNLEELSKKIRSNPKVTATFISVDVLRGVQKRELQRKFGVPVFDRYSIVLQIFKERAKTKEAKMQVGLAEIPYLRSLIRDLQEGARGGGANEGGGAAAIGGSGESYFEVQRQLLGSREKKLQIQLQRLEKQREVLKAQRQRKELPVVAVVGYTNAGKTSLIKALTGDPDLQPRDALFATLDVTAHACQLPCRLSVILMDTVGFIARIPTALVAAFNATLRDALDADLILHVQDVSHPDWLSQRETVESTLRLLLQRDLQVINIANKVDKVDTFGEQDGDLIAISATRGLGLSSLIQRIENDVLESTGRMKLTVRIPSGGEEYSWIHRETAVAECRADPKDSQYLIMDIVITKAVLGRLRHYFPKIQVKKSVQ